MSRKTPFYPITKNHYLLNLCQSNNLPHRLFNIRNLLGRNGIQIT